MHIIQIILLFSPPCLNAQANLEWQISLGGSNTDQAESV
jgi:hypothetical protein